MSYSNQTIIVANVDAPNQSCRNWTSFLSETFFCCNKFAQLRAKWMLKCSICQCFLFVQPTPPNPTPPLVEALIIWVLKCIETSQENKTFFFHFRWQKLPTETNAFYSYPENKVGKKYLQTSICIMPILLSPLFPKLSPQRFAYQTGLVLVVIPGGGALPGNRLMGTCRWMGSHIIFTTGLTKMGSHFQ